MTLSELKIAMRISSTAFDSELNSLMASSLLDLEVAGVDSSVDDALVDRAIITYCQLHFGEVTDKDWDRLKASYDEQKAQLSMFSGHTDWSDAE